MGAGLMLATKDKNTSVSWTMDADAQPAPSPSSSRYSYPSSTFASLGGEINSAKTLGPFGFPGFFAGVLTLLQTNTQSLDEDRKSQER